MNTTTSLIGTGVIVAIGKWARDEKLSVSIAVGVAGSAIILAIIHEADAELASQFALMIFLLAMFRYLPAIVEKLGY